MCKYLYKSFLLFFLLAFTVGQRAHAQQADFTKLAAFFTSIADFDYQYPRERVYLHLDNNAYFMGETLWFKAYVVRSSSLCPDTTISRVLYVELLDTDGELVERKLLYIDSLGQANGEFKLELPVRGGRFYEVRAYTREMLNWGEKAYYSRVVPVFEERSIESNSPLQILRPASNTDLSHNHPRPFHFGKEREIKLTFFPEGGHRAEDLPCKIAFELTDGKGVPRNDTFQIFSEKGELLSSISPIHSGRGLFTLPAGAGKAYALVEGKRIELPQPNEHQSHTLQVEHDNQGLSIIVSRSPKHQSELLGLVVLCRDRAVYFDTLTVGNLPVELNISQELLGDGVNRIALMQADGTSLATRLVWGNSADARRISMKIRQSAKTFLPLSPIALECYLTDSSGQPVETTFSLAVRDAGSEVASSLEPDLCIEMLLSSELRGFIEEPAWYFEKNDASRRQALDVLLMVQGWEANSIERMAGVEPPKFNHPIEDRLVLQGRVLKNNNREQPRAGILLGLRMFNREGYSLQSQATTDSLGRFTFASETNYWGDWVAQFSTRQGDKYVWSRVALDRWFGLSPRPFDFREMEIKPPLQHTSVDTTTHAELFEWTDTLPYTAIHENLQAATVTYRGYRGFRGNRYSYQGGEQAGMRHASLYYNIETLVEQRRDAGADPGLIWNLLREKDRGFDFYEDLDRDDIPYMRLLGALGDTAGDIQTGATYMFTYNGRPAIVFVDNELFMQLRKGDQPFIFADEVKSVVIMHNPNDYRRFLPSGITAFSDIMAINPSAIFLYTRPDYAFFRTKKGIEKRTIHGFSQPAVFYNPDYRGIDPPTPNDHRRTLYWNPSIRSDHQGKATAVFYSPSHNVDEIIVSARGITPNGMLLYNE